MIAVYEDKKMRYKALIILAMMTLLVVPSGSFAEMYRFTQSEIEHAKAVHAHHVEALMRLPGVKGVGIGETLGRPGIIILVDDESRLPNMPEAIEDMSAVTWVVGEITAHAINLGISGGNSLICNGYCASGTVGFKVCDNTTAEVDGVITNNHVAASGCPNLCPNNAPLGTIFFSPGVIDNNPVCSTTGATAVGALNRFVPIVLDGSTTNYVDAAFVKSTDSLVSNNIQGLGVQNNAVVAAYLGQTVCKSGRTSGVTCGIVSGINLTVNVDYGQACGVGRFSNMILYSPTAPYTVMSEPGDSGSPVVDAETNSAVALNVASTQSGIGVGNLIGAVLSALQVSLCDSVEDTTPPTDGILTPTPGNGQVVLNWTAATDAGSGLRSTDTYKLVVGQGLTPPANCSGTAIYQGSALSYTNTGLTNGLTYSYRLCSYDNAGNVSAGATASAQPLLFSDVPSNYWAYSYILSIFNAGITAGCGNGNYCPESSVTRDQMAVFIIRSMIAAGLLPSDFTYSPTAYFTDVSSGHWAFKYVQKMKELEITAGCGNGNYCPDSSVTRGQMAVLIIKALYGTDPVCNGDVLCNSTSAYFTDVPSSDVFFKYIQKMKETEITSGCSATQYCPTNTVTRAQMAVFLTKGFLQ